MLAALTIVLWPASIRAQNSFAPQGGEFAPALPLPGDQVQPRVAVRSTGGFIVWQDSAMDGDGFGIGAQALNNNLSGVFGTYRVNQIGAGHQENPRVGLLADGGAVFTWQGGAKGFQKIYARFIGPDGVFTTGDVMVNTYTNEQQINPALAVLADNSVVIAWGSFGQDGSMQGVFAQRLASNGDKLGSEFRVNQTTTYNQRSPAIAPLSGGRFVVTWVSESLRGVDALGFESFNVDIMARIYDATAQPLGDEFKVSTAITACANPAVAPAASGGFTVAWSQTDAEVRTNSWDVWVRAFNGGGAPVGDAARVNTTTYGDQFMPRIETLGAEHLVVWTSLGQDGSREGIYGRRVNDLGVPIGAEFRVNTLTRAAQLHPALAADGTGRFLVVWANLQPGSGYDIAAQRYSSSQPLPVLSAPTLTAVSGSRLLVSWADLEGYNVTSYQLYINGSATPVSVTNNYHVLTGLVAGSAQSVRIEYTLADGRRGTTSPAAGGSTWGEDANFDGLPDDWQALHWGEGAFWPGPNVDSDGDGATNLQEFLAGTDPRDPTSVLRVGLEQVGPTMRLQWNARAGSIYQVQSSSDFRTWQNVGRARFAPGAADSVALDNTNAVIIYRIIRIR